MRGCLSGEKVLLQRGWLCCSIPTRIYGVPPEVQILPRALLLNLHLTNIPMIFVAKLKSGEEINTVALDATSYTEAEILANRVGAVICSSGFTVDSIVKTQFKEVLESAMVTSSTDSRFYKAKVVAMEETASGKEKPKRYLYLVRA